jgi:hypothetical protein
LIAVGNGVDPELVRVLDVLVLGGLEAEEPGRVLVELEPFDSE